MTLAATLGTPSGLAQVDAAIESLRNELMKPHEAISPDELASIAHALKFLSAAIQAMESIAGNCMIRLGAGTVNCVG